MRADAEGYLTSFGRTGEVVTAGDHRIHPDRLEAVLVQHPAVAEAAVVPGPDPVRVAVPKAYVVLAPGPAPDADTARSVLGFAREQLPADRRIRRLEFGELPKPDSGRIRRVELRAAGSRDERPPGEFRDDDFGWDS